MYLYFSVFWGFVDIILWKGIWDGINCIFGQEYLTATITFCLGLVVLTAFGTLRSTVSVPIGFIIDDMRNCCEANTYLQTKVYS